MIIDEKILVNITRRNKNYYKKLGYDIPNIINTKIEIYTKDLSKGSDIKVKCECDVCKNIKNVTYKKYKKSTDKYGYYSCIGCSQSKRKQTCKNNFGVEYPFQSDEIKEKRKQTYIKNYGVENPHQNKEIKEKIKQTCLLKYGVENPHQNEEIKEKAKQTLLSKYGVENAFHLEYFKEKAKQTCLLKYGVEHPLQNNYIYKKIEKTCLSKYGVRHPSQFNEIHIKQQKSSLKRIHYHNSTLYYQGTYEKDFLDKYYNNIDIENGPTIKYNYEGDNNIYYSDFYIKSKNLIIEIKSDYYYKLHLNKNLTKQKSCIEQGYNFIFIINKDYSKLNEIIK